MIIPSEVETLVDRALAEDLSAGDITTNILVPSDQMGKGVLVAKEEGILAGIDVARLAFIRTDPSLSFTPFMVDSSHLNRGDSSGEPPKNIIAEIEGRVASILSAERTSLNILRHLSGIASETAKYVRAISDYDTKILDTRKTTPGLRFLEKYAVRMGGGHNHRHSLGDGILIKDNHIKVMKRSGIVLKEIVEKARSEAPHTLSVEVEVENLNQVREAIEASADIILLDNMSISLITEAVKLAKGKAIVEASGRMNLGNIREVAATGVSIISVGALTHSSNALDISLDLT